MFVLFIGSSCQKINVEQEKEAIKSVIDAEIRASFYGDYDSWINCFAHEPYTFWLQADQVEHHYWQGWEEISTAAKDIIKPERTAGKIYEGYYDQYIKVYKEAATTFFKSRTTVIRQDDGEEYEQVGMEVRFLEKNNDEWKITYLETRYLSSDEAEVTEHINP